MKTLKPGDVLGLLEADYELLKDEAMLLKEGILLLPVVSKESSTGDSDGVHGGGSHGVVGKVCFSLEEVPVSRKTIWKTQRGNLVQKPTERSVVISAPISTGPSTGGRERQSSSQRVIALELETDEEESFESEYELFMDGGRLLREGCVIRTLNQSRDEGRVIYRLTDLMLNVPYLTDKKHVFIRTNEFLVQFGNKTIDISKATSPFTSLENASFEISKIIDDLKKPKAAAQVVVPVGSTEAVNLSFLNTIKFEALLKILGGKFVKRTIVVSKKNIKISRKEKTLVKEVHGSFAVLADIEDQRQFTLVIKKKSYHFIALNSRQRDEVLNAIRTLGGEAKQIN